MEDYIKVFIPLNDIRGEWVWATKTKEHQAEVCNIPFCTNKVSLGDIISYKYIPDQGLTFVKRIKRVTKNVVIRYKSNSDEEGKNNYARIAKHCLSKGMKCEGAMPGIIAIAYPAKLKLKELDSALDEIKDLFVLS